MADLKHAKDLQPSYDLALSHNGTEKWADNFAVRMIERIDDLERQLAEARKFHEASQQGAESFLAQTGYSDSRPHSAPSIARLMQDYADLRLAEAKKLAEWTPITEQQKPVGRDHLLYVDSDGMDLYAIGYFNRLAQRWFVNGTMGECDAEYTHFRPISPPQPEKPSTTA